MAYVDGAGLKLLAKSSSQDAEGEGELVQQIPEVANSKFRSP